MTVYAYSIKYRRNEPMTRRVWRMVVEARDADEARRIAAARDPKFLATVESPRRRGVVVRA